jgi:Cu/Ag efflux pump CusA
VVVGGLAISTILTLYVLPSMYHIIEHWAERRYGEARWGR